MVPLVAVAEEFSHQARVVRAAAAEAVEAAAAAAAAAGAPPPPPLDLKVGSMIETPRACLRAGRLAAVGAEFVSFGSNDLTGFTLGFSRDDAEQKFLPQYLKAGIIPCDPFEALDEAGVGELIALAIERGRAARPDLEVGLCGEHGGDARSIAFLAAAGVDYVSVSPLRVPVARLAAAQAAVRARAAAGRGDEHCQE